MKVHTIIGDSVKVLEKQVNQYLSSCKKKLLTNFNFSVIINV